MKAREAAGRLGFSLPEVLLALLLLGLVVGPVLALVQTVQVSRQSLQLAASRSVGHDHIRSLLSRGVDPSRVEAAGGRRPAAAGWVAWTWEARSVGGGPGRLARRALVGRPAVADSNESGTVGWVMGSGSPPPDLGPITPPLPPVVLDPPRLGPTGARPWVEFVVGGEGPGRAAWRSTGAAAGHRVVVRVLRPAPQQVDGRGGAVLGVPADDAALGVEGETWAEHDGDPAAGEIAEMLPDGRRRWWRPTGTGLQRIEPSARVGFGLGIDLGPPVLRLGSDEYVVGDEVAIDLGQAERIASGQDSADVDWPDEVARVFGARWSTLRAGLAFEVEFGRRRLGTSGTLEVLFSAPERAHWQEENELGALPVAGGGLAAGRGYWILHRRRIDLAPPERTSAPDFTDALVGETWSPPAGGGRASAVFRVPPVDGRPTGRIRFGRLESTGPEIRVEIPAP